MCTISCDVPVDKSQIFELEFNFHDWTSEHADYQRRDLSAQGNFGGNWGENSLWESNGIVFNNKIKKWGPSIQTTGVVKDMVTPSSANTSSLAIQPQGTHTENETAACTSTGVTQGALSADPNPGTVKNPRPCAKDFDTWYMMTDPGQCPLKRHLPFKYWNGNLWQYDSSKQGVPAPEKSNPGYKGFFPLDNLGWNDTLPCRGSKWWNDQASPLVWTDIGTTAPAEPKGAVELTDAYDPKVETLKKDLKEGITTFTQADWNATYGFIVLMQNYVESGGHYYRAQNQLLSADKPEADTCTEWLNNKPYGWWWGERPDLAHNFAFSTQITRKFKYIASKMNKDFMLFDGDDDVWGYLQSDQDSRYHDAHLVVDIGGIHREDKDAFWLGTPADRAAAGAGAKWPALSLQDGAYYTIILFHAERQLYQSNFVMYVPMVECLCIDDESKETWNTYDDRFPRDCRSNPYTPTCDGQSFPYESESKAMVTAASATTFPNGITSSNPAHALCKTCKTECFGTAAGDSCKVCPECKGQGSGADAKCPSTE